MHADQQLIVHSLIYHWKANYNASTDQFFFLPLLLNILPGMSATLFLKLHNVNTIVMKKPIE